MFLSAVPSLPHIRRGRDGDGASDFGVIDMDAPKPANSVEDPRASGPREDVPTGHTGENRRAREFDADPTVLGQTPPSSRGRSPRPPVATSPEVASGDEPKDNLREYVIPEPSQQVKEAVEGDLDEVLGGGKGDEGAAGPDLEALASEVRADVDEGDYRSHYDLGMAYLEMGLLPEAIREFQIALQSPVFKVRSLEMIGRCFLTQNEPELAIKQLTMGLALVDGDDRAALGIKYGLALAYEMTGEPDKAKAFYQDVYVVDASFRDVGEKIRRYAS